MKEVLFITGVLQIYMPLMTTMPGYAEESPVTWSSVDGAVRPTDGVFSLPSVNGALYTETQKNLIWSWNG